MEIKDRIQKLKESFGEKNKIKERLENLRISLEKENDEKNRIKILSIFSSLEKLNGEIEKIEEEIEEFKPIEDRLLALKEETLTIIKELSYKNDLKYAFKEHTHLLIDKKFASYVLKEHFERYKDEVLDDVEKILNRISDNELKTEKEKIEFKKDLGYAKRSITDIWKKLNNKLRHRDLTGLKWSESKHIIDIDFDLRGNRLVNLGDPKEKKDATTKEYVDNLVQRFGRVVYGGGKIKWGELEGTITDQIDLISYIASQIAPENLWDRTGTVLSPHTAGDSIEVANIKDNGLTPSKLVKTDANNNLVSGDEADPVAMVYLNQAVKNTSSPTFAGLTLTAFSGFLKATAGVIGTSTISVSDITDIATNYWKIDQTTPQTAVGTHIFPAVKTDHIGEKTPSHSIVADNDISISAGKKLIFLAS